MAPGDVALSERSARELRVSMGAVINAGVNGRGASLRLRVTGIYAVPNLTLPYWWGGGVGYFSYGHVEAHAPELDSFVTSMSTALAVPVQDVPAVEGQVPLKATAVGISDQGYLQRALVSAHTTVADQGVVLSTQLPQIISGAAQQQNGMATIVAIASVQLVLVSVWILGNLLVRSSEARQAEMRVARLRGFPPLSLLAVTTAEPVILCVFGFALGMAVAWGAVVVARDRLLDPAAVISPDVWVFAALALTVLAIAGALFVATWRFVRSSGLSGDRGPAPATARRWGMVADIVLLVLAAVALVALATSGSLGGRANPIASAAPGLIALGMAVVAVQFVRLVCRFGVSASAHSERVAAFLALRQIVRRPAMLRVGRVLIIALCLACFASAAWSVARSNRATAAGFEVGSDAVVTVTPHGPPLEQAVDRADPRGRFAMAVVEVATPSSTLLAVDAPRLPAVASWPAGISGSTIAATSRALDQPTAPEVDVPDAPIQVSATATGTSRAAAGLGSLDLSLSVFNPQAGTTTLNLGPLHADPRTYRGSPGYVCPGGCRLAGLGVVPGRGRTTPSSGAVHLSVTRVATRTPSGAWETVSADLLPHGWLSNAPGVQAAVVPGGGLVVTIPASVVGSFVGPAASPNDRPAALPGAVTSTVESLNGGGTPHAQVPSQGLDGNELAETFGLGSVARRPVHQLSGGEQQRVAMASAVATSPNVLLADEPTCQLDAAARDSVIDALRRAHDLSGATVIVVTHDSAVAAALPRTLTISHGVIGSEGRGGQRFSIVGRDGTVQLPAEVLARYPPGTLLRVEDEGTLIELRPEREVESEDPGAVP